MTGSTYFSVGYHSALSTFGHKKIKPPKTAVDKFLQENEWLFTHKQFVEYEKGVRDFLLTLEEQRETERRRATKKSLPLYKGKQNPYDKVDRRSLWCVLSIMFFGHD